MRRQAEQGADLVPAVGAALGPHQRRRHLYRRGRRSGSATRSAPPPCRDRAADRIPCRFATSLLPRHSIGSSCSPWLSDWHDRDRDEARAGDPWCASRNSPADAAASCRRSPGPSFGIARSTCSCAQWRRPQLGLDLDRRRGHLVDAGPSPRAVPAWVAGPTNSAKTCSARSNCIVQRDSS